MKLSTAHYDKGYPS